VVCAARIGGDEFVVVAPARSSVDSDGAASLAARIASLTQGQFDLGGMLLDYDGPSVGVVTSRADEASAAALVARADAAMYAVKRERRRAR
jgi:diguanylate cyclase